MLEKVAKRIKRHSKVRSQISGTSNKPRLAVYRSNTEIYAQMIDDEAGKTLCQSSSLKSKTGNKVEKASKVGEDLASKALALGIKECVFDRGGFLYIGRVKALAEGARKGGLQF